MVIVIRRRQTDVSTYICVYGDAGADGEDDDKGDDKGDDKEEGGDYL